MTNTFMENGSHDPQEIIASIDKGIYAVNFGNGRRESYSSIVLPRMTNTFIKNGSHDPQEIIASIDKGIYAINFSGGQVDITSGKFVFSASEAWWMKKGKLQYSVKGSTIVGSGPEVLKHVILGCRNIELHHFLAGATAGVGYAYEEY